MGFSTTSHSKIRRFPKCAANTASVKPRCNWRSKYGGMSVDELKRLKELEYGNVRLKRIAANQGLEIEAIKDLLTKEF